MKAAGDNGLVKVAFDASALKSRYSHHGIQVYTRNLLNALRGAVGGRGMEIRPFVPEKDESNDIFIDEPGFRPRKSAWSGSTACGAMAAPRPVRGWMAPTSC